MNKQHIATILRESRHFLWGGRERPNWGQERYLCYAIERVKEMQTLDFDQEEFEQAKAEVMVRLNIHSTLFDHLSKDHPELGITINDWITSETAHMGINYAHSEKWCRIRDDWLDALIAELEGEQP